MASVSYQGTYTIGNATTNPSYSDNDVIEAWLNGNLVASSDCAVGDIYYCCSDESPCAPQEYRLKFSTDDSNIGDLVTFRLVSQNHSTIGFVDGYAACDYIVCGTTTFNPIFNLPDPTISFSDGVTYTIWETDTQNVSITIETNDGYGNTDWYWDDSSLNVGVWINHQWATNDGEDGLNNITPIGSDENFDSIYWQPSGGIVGSSPIEYTFTGPSFPADDFDTYSESYDVTFYATATTSENPFNLGNTAGQTSVRHYFIVKNDHYVAPITGCTNSAALNYICLDEDINNTCPFEFPLCYCNESGPTYKVTDDGSCNFNPNVTFQVTTTAGSLTVNINNITDVGPNVDPATDWDYCFDWNGSSCDVSVVDRNDNDSFDYTYTLPDSYTIRLVATDAQGETSIHTQDITLTECGCMDSNAVNHNENATDENGSCVYSGCPYTEANNDFCESYESGDFPYPCSGFNVNGSCGSNKTYSLNDVDDDGSCTFPDAFETHNYSQFLSWYIGHDVTPDANFTYQGEEMSFENLDDQLVNFISTNYDTANYGFTTYFNDTISQIETRECPNYCWDTSNGGSGYCTQANCNSWHDGLIECGDCYDLDSDCQPSNACPNTMTTPTCYDADVDGTYTIATTGTYTLSTEDVYTTATTGTYTIATEDVYTTATQDVYTTATTGTYTLSTEDVYTIATQDVYTTATTGTYTIATEDVYTTATTGTYTLSTEDVYTTATTGTYTLSTEDVYTTATTGTYTLSTEDVYTIATEDVYIIATHSSCQTEGVNATQTCVTNGSSSTYCTDELNDGSFTCEDIGCNPPLSIPITPSKRRDGDDSSQVSPFGHLISFTGDELEVDGGAQTGDGSGALININTLFSNLEEYMCEGTRLETLGYHITNLGGFSNAALSMEWFPDFGWYDTSFNKLIPGTGYKLYLDNSCEEATQIPENHTFTWGEVS